VLRHFRLTLEGAQFNTDKDDFGFGSTNSGEMSFFFVNVDRSPDEWIRLSDHALNSSGGTLMQSVTAPEEVPLTDAYFDFYVEDGAPFTIRGTGFDGGVGEGAFDPTQDCLDEHVAHHDFSEHVDFTGLDFPDLASLAGGRSRQPSIKPLQGHGSFTRNPATGHGRAVSLCLLRCDDHPRRIPFPPDVPCTGQALRWRVDNSPLVRVQALVSWESTWSSRVRSTAMATAAR
jgi:hypothetical protein